MFYEVYSKATDRVLGTYTTEREAYARAASVNSAKFGNKARHWSKKAIVRPAMNGAFNREAA